MLQAKVIGIDSQLERAQKHLPNPQTYPHHACVIRVSSVLELRFHKTLWALPGGQREFRWKLVERVRIRQLPFK